MQARYVNPYTDFGFKKIFGEASEIAKFKPKERLQYEESLKIYWDMVNVLDTSFEQGIKEGEQIGLEKGEQIGLEKGEHKKAIETACQMLKDGMSIELISKYTGLTVEFKADLQCP